MESSRRWMWVVAAAVVVGGGAGVWLAMNREATPPPAPQPVEPTLPAPLPKDEALPGREASDARVRELLGPLSSLPAWKEWLAQADLLNRFVGAADNLAEGETPRTHLDFLKPKGPFAVVDRSGKTVMDPKAAARYDAFADVIGSIDAKAAAGAYEALRPWLRTAYHAFGYPDRDFDETAKKALHRVLHVPAVDSPELVSVKGALYKFADPALESLPDAEKQLLRMGARNQKLVQGKAAELRSILFPNPG